MNTTEQMEAKLAQHRKNGFICARLTVKCLEENTDKTKCFGCKCFRICREITDFMSNEY
jgi:hypothetical protein